MHQPTWLFFVLISQSLRVCIALWFDKDPFNFWQDRLVYRNLEQLSVTEKTIERAIHNYGQSSFRVWAFFQKVWRGESIEMIVIGGSNSAGGGITDHRQLYHQLFLQWWNNVILPYTGSKITIRNLSLGGTGSDFFSLCLQNYLLKSKEPDLVLIELSVNDYGYLYGVSAQPMEQLTRRVLSFSSKPLVMYVTLVDLIEKVNWWKKILNPKCFNLEDVGQQEIARYYNITVFSWRDVVCPMDKKNSKRRIEIKADMINEDHIHIGIKSHAQIAVMLTRYFQKVLRRVASCPRKSKMKLAEFHDKREPLFIQLPNQMLISKPFCWSLISTNWRISGETTQSLEVKVLIRKGFYEITPQNMNARMMRTGADRSDSFGGWRSRQGISYIEFSITVPKMAGKSKRWSVGVVLRCLRNGSIKVWLCKKERNPLTIKGKSYGRILLQTRIYFLGTAISSGIHKMQIHTEGREGFDVLLSGIILGPVGMEDIKEYKPTNTLQKVWSHEDYKTLLLDSME
ncbi:uncharacterized protein LOC144636916 [Oculina patagonica]